MSRKVFIQNMFMQNPQFAINQPTTVSDDYNIDGLNFRNALSYIIALNVKPGDNVVIISSGPEPDDSNDSKYMMQNHKIFQEEIAPYLEGANVEYKMLYQPRDFSSNTFTVHVKKLLNMLEPSDQLYLDITYGMKPYTLAQVAALCAMVKSCDQVTIEEICYKQLFKGSDHNIARLFNLTELFSLNDLIFKLTPGDRNGLLRYLDIITEE